MQHQVDFNSLPQSAAAMADPIESCVHCGFCLPTCPTYVTLGQEMDSPRGRIFVMKEVLEGSLELDSAVPYIDNCLGCQACVSACPSGVEYGDLITSFRQFSEARRSRPMGSRVQRSLALRTLPYPARFRAAVRLGRLARIFRSIAPPAVRPMLELAPPRLPPARPLPEWFPARGRRRARVALLGGCVQQALEPDIGWATLRVLAANGVETVVPRGQGCCGALAMHTGAANQARALARRNLAAFGGGIDAIVSNAAGCGSGMREYPVWFAGESDEHAARAFAERVVDVSTFLDELGIVEPPPLDRPRSIAYHDACHLAHAQGVRRPPRSLLRAIPGVTLIEPAEWELCCGSAGTYNLEKPDIAEALGARKAANLRGTGAELIASGNIGCLLQIRRYLGAEPAGEGNPAVLHTMQVLDRAYRGARRGLLDDHQHVEGAGAVDPGNPLELDVGGR
ncbi:MAG TPA: heterodisulfide reductase-related iron-sulfur binding cluster [Solirubrobacteraceae bacterium]